MESKYFNKETISLMQRTESNRRSSESFFSSKSDNDNFFGSSTGNSLKVVGVEHIKGSAGVGAFNVVKFDDGHQMSTSKFFAAKGLKWPVGGNVAKLNYLCSALETGVEVSVTPEKVESKPMQRKDGTYVGPKGSDGKTVVLQPIELKDDKGKPTGQFKAPEGALEAVTYYFVPMEMPEVELVSWEE